MLTGSNPSSLTEDKLFPQKYTLQIKGRLITLDKPKIIGILNLTPDSFYQASRVENDSANILSKARKMLSEGADFFGLRGV
ncbi:dihydropteroate synthase [Algoriphagus boritolerans]|uniref:dihydropteroate synthase n=1 Tax=Algoriphagus boritolerans TaxID=308111 RepID=UPI002FCE57F2